MRRLIAHSKKLADKCTFRIFENNTHFVFHDLQNVEAVNISVYTLVHGLDTLFFLSHSWKKWCWRVEKSCGQTYVSSEQVMANVKCTFFHICPGSDIYYSRWTNPLFHCSTLKEAFLQQTFWNRAASTWTPRDSSLSTRYFVKFLTKQTAIEILRLIFS